MKNKLHKSEKYPLPRPLCLSSCCDPLVNSCSLTSVDKNSLSTASWEEKGLFFFFLKQVRLGLEYYLPFLATYHTNWVPNSYILIAFMEYNSQFTQLISFLRGGKITKNLSWSNFSWNIKQNKTSKTLKGVPFFLNRSILFSVVWFTIKKNWKSKFNVRETS